MTPYFCCHDDGWESGTGREALAGDTVVVTVQAVAITVFGGGAGVVDFLGFGLSFEIGAVIDVFFAHGAVDGFTILVALDD